MSLNNNVKNTIKIFAHPILNACGYSNLIEPPLPVDDNQEKFNNIELEKINSNIKENYFRCSEPIDPVKLSILLILIIIIIFFIIEYLKKKKYYK